MDDQFDQYYCVWAYYFIGMEKMLVRSRSVVVDASFKRGLQDSYDKHKSKLDQIRNRKNMSINEEYDGRLRQQTNSKRASQRIRDEFDPSKLETRAMVTHIQSIYHRPRDSIQEFKRYRNITVQKEKKEIERQNNILKAKIKDQIAHRLTKKDIKKQFKVYQSQKSMLRKVNYHPKTEKKKRKRTSSQTKQEGEH